jgi:hypothetical protein
LQFDYKVLQGQNASDLEISGFNLGGVKDRAGNTVDLAGAPHQPAGTLAVNTTASTAVTSTAVNTAAPVVAPTTPTLAESSNLAGVPSDFGNKNTTLGYAANTGTASGTSTVADGTLASQLALFNQYVASSFASPASTVGALLQQPAWGSISPTLAKSIG